MQPVGQNRTYLGIDVFEGAYTYRGMQIVPGWGGTMFEELMPEVFVPERAGRRGAGASTTRSRPGPARARAGGGRLRLLGILPSSNPAGGYREYGVDALGLNPDGYFSDQEGRTTTRLRRLPRGANPNPMYGDGVVTPTRRSSR